MNRIGGPTGKVHIFRSVRINYELGPHRRCLIKYRNSAPSPWKSDSPRVASPTKQLRTQTRKANMFDGPNWSRNWSCGCCVIYRFCALGWSFVAIQSSPQIEFGHGTVFPWAESPIRLFHMTLENQTQPLLFSARRNNPSNRVIRFWWPAQTRARDQIRSSLCSLAGISSVPSRPRHDGSSLSYC